MQNEHLLAGLKTNKKTGLYEICEHGVTYIFNFDMMTSLRSYLAEVDTKQNTDLINSWYKSLPLRKRLNIFVLLQDMKKNHQNAIL